MRAQRISNDQFDPADLEWLSKGFSAFLSSGGRLPLERCLRLPKSHNALRRARRDHWLRQAWLELSEIGSTWRRSEALVAEIRRFETSKWPRWSALESPPAGTSALHAALFEAFRAHERMPSTAMQLHNIAKK
jgi:hypothetical protein